MNAYIRSRNTLDKFYNLLYTIFAIDTSSTGYDKKAMLLVEKSHPKVAKLISDFFIRHKEATYNSSNEIKHSSSKVEKLYVEWMSKQSTWDTKKDIINEFEKEVNNILDHYNDFLEVAEKVFKQISHDM